MSNHTPGPWTWTRSADNGYFSINIHQADDAGETQHSSDIGFIAQHFVVDAPLIAEANAKLLAAAPELLEALQDMLSGWRYIRESHGDLYGVGWDRAQEKAESAIAKAEGVKC